LRRPRGAGLDSAASVAIYTPMTSRDFSHWMWSEALAMLDRAERMHRQFFTHTAACWEPPVDIVESGDRLQVQVALPGVPAGAIHVEIEPAGVAVSALRPFPGAREASQVHRIEIPYGRFERRIALPLADPYAPLELAGQELADGVLTLTFRKKSP
jgi:HSP20 family molecular chaperone IbpA